MSASPQELFSEVREMIPHAPAVAVLALSPSGQLLATTAEDLLVRVWRPGDKRPEMTLSGAEDCIQALSWDPQGQLVAMGDACGAILVWDLQKRVLFRGAHGDGETGVLALAWHPGGGLLASVAADDSIAIWNLETRRAAEWLSPPFRRSRRGSRAAALTPERTPPPQLLFGTEVLAVGWASGRLGLWELGVAGAASQVRGNLQLAGPVLSLAFRPGGQELLALTGKGGLQRINLVRFRLLAPDTELELDGGMSVLSVVLPGDLAVVAEASGVSVWQLPRSQADDSKLLQDAALPAWPKVQPRLLAAVTVPGPRAALYSALCDIKGAQIRLCRTELPFASAAATPGDCGQEDNSEDEAADILAASWRGAVPSQLGSESPRRIRIRPEITVSPTHSPPPPQQQSTPLSFRRGLDPSPPTPQSAAALADHSESDLDMEPMSDLEFEEDGEDDSPQSVAEEKGEDPVLAELLQQMDSEHGLMLQILGRRRERLTELRRLWEAGESLETLRRLGSPQDFPVTVDFLHSLLGSRFETYLRLALLYLELLAARVSLFSGASADEVERQLLATVPQVRRLLTQHDTNGQVADTGEAGLGELAQALLHKLLPPEGSSVRKV